MKSITEELKHRLNRAMEPHGYLLCANPDNPEEQIQVAAGRATHDFLKQLAEDSEKADPREIANTLIAAFEGDKGIQQQLCEVRVKNVQNFIISDSTFAQAFFDIVSLQPDEEPFYVNETMTEVNVGLIGENGQPRMIKTVKPEERTSIALDTLMSEEVRYRIEDIYRGRIDGIARKTFNIAEDLRIKWDRKHYDLLTASVANGGCYGAFSTEQSRSNKATRIYVNHSIIDTSQLPTTNDYDMNEAAGSATNPATDGSLTKFGVKVLKAIEGYAHMWANVLPDSNGSRLVPTGEIIVPSKDIISIADEATPNSSVTEVRPPDRMQEDINRNGFTELTYLGRRWRFIADVTIPLGTCFPRFNLLPGTTYVKPSYDREFVETNIKTNWESRVQRRAYGAAIISQHRPRGMRLKYIA